MRRALTTVNKGMVAVDLALATTALFAPRTGLRLLGHRAPGDDAAWLFRRCGPIWLTFAAAHLTAAARGRPEDWWALAWLRATEIGTDALWAQSPASPPTRAAARCCALPGWQTPRWPWASRRGGWSCGRRAEQLAPGEPPQ